MPDAYEVEFDDDGGDYLVLMASDGLWDAVGNERVLELVVHAHAQRRRFGATFGDDASLSPFSASRSALRSPEVSSEFAAAVTAALVAESELSPDNLSIAMVAVLAPRVRAST